MAKRRFLIVLCLLCLLSFRTPVISTAAAVEPDVKNQMKVLLLWKGDKDRTRPRSVQVEILRNGESYETVTLSEENQWVYSWPAPEDGANWTVVEQNVPEGYVATVENRGAAFVLTNTYRQPEPPEAHETGDTINVMLCILLLNISGLVLVILGVVGRRKRA